MFFKQYYLSCLAHASYLIADEKTGAAAVVDPQRDINQYLLDARLNGFRVEHVILTHFHADFLAGHLEMKQATGATIHLGKRAEAEFEFQPASDGDVIELGEVELSILETPGHTPEGISVLVHNPYHSVDPYAVLTGDTLFIGDVGRPDLLASVGVTADELAEMLYESLHGKLMKLPDETRVYPAHGAGSLCGKNISDETVSTIGEQKKMNYALRPMSKDGFIQMVTSDLPEAPDYFVYDAVQNRKSREVLENTLERNLNPISLDALLDTINDEDVSVQLLDTREAKDFEASHMRGAMHIGLKGKYATWCGTLLNHEDPIIVITDEGDEQEAVMRLGRIGFDNVAGYLEGGMHALAGRPELLGVIDRISAHELKHRLENEPGKWQVVDVRSDKEREANGVIQGSQSIPLPELKRDLAAHANMLNSADRNIVLHCAGGYRSAMAASLLAIAGLKPIDLIGGFAAYQTNQNEQSSNCSISL